MLKLKRNSSYTDIEAEISVMCVQTHPLHSSVYFGWLVFGCRPHLRHRFFEYQKCIYTRWKSRWGYIHIRPYKIWTSSCQTAWKMLNPAYERTEPSRLWQLAVERRLKMNHVLRGTELLQMLLMHCASAQNSPSIAKIVVDFLFVGTA